MSSVLGDLNSERCIVNASMHPDRRIGPYAHTHLKSELMGKIRGMACETQALQIHAQANGLVTLSIQRGDPNSHSPGVQKCKRIVQQGFVPDPFANICKPTLALNHLRPLANSQPHESASTNVNSLRFAPKSLRDATQVVTPSYRPTLPGSQPRARNPHQATISQSWNVNRANSGAAYYMDQAEESLDIAGWTFCIIGVVAVICLQPEIAVPCFAAADGCFGLESGIDIGRDAAQGNWRGITYTVGGLMVSNSAEGLTRELRFKVPEASMQNKLNCVVSAQIAGAAYQKVTSSK